MALEFDSTQRIPAEHQILFLETPRALFEQTAVVIFSEEFGSRMDFGNSVSALRADIS